MICHEKLSKHQQVRKFCRCEERSKYFCNRDNLDFHSPVGSRGNVSTNKGTTPLELMEMWELILEQNVEIGRK